MGRARVIMEAASRIRLWALRLQARGSGVAQGLLQVQYGEEFRVEGEMVQQQPDDGPGPLLRVQGRQDQDGSSGPMVQEGPEARFQFVRGQHGVQGQDPAVRTVPAAQRPSR